MEKDDDSNLDKNTGQVVPVEITEEMQRSYLDYAMSVIVSRALPDVRDGLKPVHRRILYAMHELGLTSEAKYRKSATVVGEVLGKYHPHGDAPVYDAMVRLAQNFAMRYPLVDGQGNFGSIDGDPPAAMRYTEARMEKIASEMLLDIEKNTVDFVDNFDGTRKEPLPLPAKLPNLLLNGSAGIAVGMATNIPPHNLNEVCDAIIHLIEHPDAGVEELMKFIKGPDFPTGGSIFDINEIKNAYATGKGRIVMKAKAQIEEGKGGKFVIIISEIPYQVNKSQLIAKIAQLVKEKRVEGISDLRDESDRRGMRIVIELKRDGKPNSVLNNLYKYTAMQLAFNVNIVALVDGVPSTLTLKHLLTEYIRHRQNVITRRTKFDLEAAKNRAHILEGLKIALDHLDEVIETIKKSKDADSAKINLINRFKFTEVQAVAILDMQLRRLAALERKKIEDEYEQLLKTIAYLEELLASPKKILGVIIDELRKLKEQFGDDRRTKVFPQPVGEFSEEDLIPKEEVVVTITKGGYVKRSPVSAYRTQARGGKGVSGVTMKEEDVVSNIFSANTHDSILFFTKSGKVFQLKVYDLPEGDRTAKGSAVINLIDLEQEDSVTAIITIPNTKTSGYLLMATKNGMVKKTALEEFANIRRSGVIAINLTQNDELKFVLLTSGENEIIMTSKMGMSILFSEKDIRPMGRATSGVIGIRLKENDEIIGTSIADKEASLLVVTQKGVGKRSKITDWPKQKRAGSGVKAAQITERNGPLVGANLIGKNHNEILITTKFGQVIKLPVKDVPILTRQTQGVILIRLSDEDTVAAITAVKKQNKERIEDSVKLS